MAHQTNEAAMVRLASLAASYIRSICSHHPSLKFRLRMTVAHGTLTKASPYLTREYER
jgi:hypothetical protein